MRQWSHITCPNVHVTPVERLMISLGQPQCFFSMHRFTHEDHFHFVDNIDIPPFDNYPSYKEALALGTQPITTRQIATPAMILTFLYPYKIGVTAQAAKHGFQSLQLNYSPLHEWLNQALYH